MRAVATIDESNRECNHFSPQHQPAFGFGYYADLSKAKDIGDLNRRVGLIVERLGFTDYAYIQLAKADSPQPELSSLPIGLQDAYFSANLHVNDMNLQRAMSSESPFFSSTIYDYVANAPFSSEMTTCMEYIHTLNKSFGYYDYYHVVTRSEPNIDPVMLSIAQRGLSPFELKHLLADSESALVLLCEAIDFVITKHFRQYKYHRLERTTINPKPLRVLETLANNDMTIEQVAEKLCISVVTANQHLKTVRTALKTKTNYAAIKRALTDKLIRFENTE